MNDEIKEILDDLRTYKDRYEYYLFNNLSFSVRDYKAKILLDYITNLQQENEKKNAYIKYLEEYNPKYYKGEKFYGVDYKSRCEKAVEYLKSNEDNLFMSFSDDMLDHDELIDKKIGTTLLDILIGRSDE